MAGERKLSKLENEIAQVIAKFGACSASEITDFLYSDDPNKRNCLSKVAVTLKRMEAKKMVVRGEKGARGAPYRLIEQLIRPEHATLTEQPITTEPLKEVFVEKEEKAAVKRILEGETVKRIEAKETITTVTEFNVTEEPQLSQKELVLKELQLAGSECSASVLAERILGRADKNAVSAVAVQLHRLETAGLLESRKAGKFRFYRLREEGEPAPVAAVQEIVGLEGEVLKRFKWMRRASASDIANSLYEGATRADTNKVYVVLQRLEKKGLLFEAGKSGRKTYFAIEKPILRPIEMPEFPRVKLPHVEMPTLPRLPERLPHIPRVYYATGISMAVMAVILFNFGGGLGLFGLAPNPLVLSIEQQQTDGLQNFIYGVSNVNSHPISQVIVEAILPANASLTDYGGASVSERNGVMVLTWLLSQINPREKQMFSFSGQIPGQIQLSASGIGEQEQTQNVLDHPVQAVLPSGEYGYRTLDVPPVGYLGEIAVDLSAGPEGANFTAETVTVPNIPIINITENITVIEVPAQPNITENATQPAQPTPNVTPPEQPAPIPQPEQPAPNMTPQPAPNATQQPASVPAQPEQPNATLPPPSTPPTGGAVTPPEQPAQPAPKTTVKIYLDSDTTFNGNEDLIGEAGLSGTWDGTLKVTVPAKKYNNSMNLVFYADNGAVVLLKSVSLKWIVEVPINATQTFLSQYYENATEISTEISVVDARNASVEADVSIKDKSGKTIKEANQIAGGKTGGTAVNTAGAAAPKHIFKVKNERQTIEVLPKQTAVKNITLYGVKAAENIELGLDKVPDNASLPPGVKKWDQIYAIDPTKTDFSYGTVTATAKGKYLYKCKEWDFAAQKCNGVWVKLMDIVPGKNYSFTLTAQDPAFSETSQNLTQPPKGLAVLLSAFWQDADTVKYAWLATNETGVWENKSGVYDSPIYINALSGWSNFTWQNTSTEINTTVGWRVYSNNSLGVENATNIYTFKVSSNRPIITWESPTPPDGQTVIQSSVYLNTTITSPLGLNTSAFFDWNYTLLGYWAMDWSNSTGVYDNSTYGYFGTFTGADFNESSISAGKYGKGITLDGTNDYIDTNLLQDGVTEYTIEAWVRMTADQGVIVQDRGASTGKSLTLAIGPSCGALGVYCANSAAGRPAIGVDSDSIWGGVNANVTVNDGEWHYIAGVFNSSSGDNVSAANFRIYVDGNDVTGAWGAVSSTTSPLTGLGGTKIGYHQAWNTYFNGEIDEVRIFKRIVLPDGVKASYNNGVNRLYRNFTSEIYANYSYYAFAIDTDGNANKTAVRTLKFSMPPQYSLPQTNSTQKGTPVKHSLYWTANDGLGHAIFSFDNCTGVLANRSTMSLNGATANWSEFTVVINSTAGCTIRWCVYANSSTGLWNGDSCAAPFSYETTENTPPTYSLNSTNSTLAGTPIVHRLKWSDNSGLDSYIFQFCNGTYNGTDCAGAQTNWLSGWSYRKLHNITGSTAGAQTNYQVKINVFNGTSSDSGGNIYFNNRCRADFGDVRFTNSANGLLDYWIENVTAGNNAKFTVELDSLPASPNNATIYVYCGNPTATNVSSGNATFLFFDDFSGDLSKWVKVKYPANLNIVNGYMEVRGGITTGDYGHSVLGSNVTFNDFYNGIIEGKINLSTSGGIGEVGFRGWFKNNTGYKSRLDQRANQGVSHLLPPYSGWGFAAGGACTASGTAVTGNVWVPFNITVNYSSFNIMASYGASTWTKSCVDAVRNNSGEISLQNHYGTYSAYDDIRVSKYVYPAPAQGSWGAEESSTGGGWANDTATTWGGGPQTGWSNVTKTVNSTVGSRIAWKVYGKDTSNNWNTSQTYTYLTTSADSEPPRYLLNGSNTTSPPAFTAVQLYANWSDNVGMNWAVLATNETGAWQNKTDVFLTYAPIDMSGGMTWSNFSWLNMSTDGGTVVAWRIYANDTSGNQNVTEINTFNVGSSVSITLTTTSVDFGSMTPNSSNSTTDNKPAPFRIRNDGNVKANITINATDLFSTAANPTANYRFAANQSSEGTNYKSVCSNTTMTNMLPVSSPTRFMCFLNWTDTADLAETEIAVTIPNSEPAGAKSSTVTFIATMA